MKKDTKYFIFYLAIVILIMLENGRQFKDYEEQIRQLEQNKIEQVEEKEVYRNRCKMMEELLEVNMTQWLLENAKAV